jgi:hypothetical protein
MVLKGGIDKAERVVEIRDAFIREEFVETFFVPL